MSVVIPYRLAGLAAFLCFPAFASVQNVTLTPSVASSQPLGTPVTWRATATNTSSNPVAFQFNVAFGTGPFTLLSDFNLGTQSGSTWKAHSFTWATINAEGTYTIQVVAKDFVTGLSATKTATYTLTSRVSGGQAAVNKTANPLVALFSAPLCAVGSSMRVSFQLQSKATPATITNALPCNGSTSMNFYIAGMYPSTAYQMFSQTITRTKIVNGAALTFTTGALPNGVAFPTFKVQVASGPNTDTAESVLLISPNGGVTQYPLTATDLSGKIIWYYGLTPPQDINLTRPLPGGNMLTIQSGPAWTSATSKLQLLRQVDLAGNIVRETNAGIVQQQLLALGATDGGPCDTIPKPAPVGSACLDTFHHDAIQTLPNGETAVLVNIEKIFPPGTQGDTSGLPVDVIGDMFVVLDANWQVIGYWDAFQHDSSSQLDINRAPVLGEVCVVNAACPPLLLMGPGIAPHASDWLHCNTLYYWPQNGDILVSSRNQDWIFKVDYRNGSPKATGNVLWRMGACGSFTFNNIYNDPWPWYSAQHQTGIQNNGAGPLTVFDDGNTRVSPPTGRGSSSGCRPGVGSGNSRGMALTINESNMQVSPVLSADLGVFSYSGGSAQLLGNGNYFFAAPNVTIGTATNTYAIEIFPTPGTDTGTQVSNIKGPEGYRAFRMPSLYNPPIN